LEQNQQDFKGSIGKKRKVLENRNRQKKEMWKGKINSKNVKHKIELQEKEM
jgi:ribosome maturation factor RimP